MRMSFLWAIIHSPWLFWHAISRLSALVTSSAGLVTLRQSSKNLPRSTSGTDFEIERHTVLSLAHIRMDSLLERCRVYLSENRDSVEEIPELQPAADDDHGDDLCDDESDESEYRSIVSSVTKNSHFPLRSSFLLLKFISHHEWLKKNYSTAALTLLYSQSLSFRHQAYYQYSKRLQQNQPDIQHAQANRFMKELLIFRPLSQELDALKDTIRGLPSHWNILQISVNIDMEEPLKFKRSPKDEAFEKSNFALNIVSMKGGCCESLSLYFVDSLVNAEQPTIMSEFKRIMSSHLRLYKADIDAARSSYRALSNELDQRMKVLIDTIENKWLGFYKVLFTGQSTDPQRSSKLKKAVSLLQASFWPDDERFECSGRKNLLEKLLDNCYHLSDAQMDQGLMFCLSAAPERLPALRKAVSVQKKPFLKPVQRHPTVLILDKEIQTLPWESMMCLNQPANPVSRALSLSFLHLLYATQDKLPSVKQKGHYFYVLNPDQNLPKTQERLETKLEKLDPLQGIIGKHPTLTQMKDILCEWNGFIYCGHGSTLKNLPGQEIERLHIRAIPMLFGCNSGKIERYGRLLEPLGVACHYLIANAPCLLGFLWSITDRDVDAWTLTFLQQWLDQTDNDRPDFVRAVASQRGCFSRLINSAALVIYGLPELSM